MTMIGIEDLNLISFSVLSRPDEALESRVNPVDSAARGSLTHSFDFFIETIFLVR